ncbi:phosphomevalonate kinase [Aphanomyces astaci]|uniref:phosphomevalonate kinase n=1 Tax=Aphanomyces astaci TaxID=112090 RepID=W4FM47_APHAT|nr:phosphomevalonate kinase [Aphanomyces astaci]ETV68572.1 phosphomevalonate kinase [Aphanomyces astaci]|eukprot:XP_009842001.1 phosphomevalonate kinase [Aphanomyces astaci]
MRVSAPGKVLITGGYLVLEPSFSGAVIAASSRFHTSITVESLEGSDDDPSSASSTSVPVRVFSPQFHQSMHGELSATSFRFAHDSVQNCYVEKTIGICVVALVGLLGAAAFEGRIRDMLRRRQTLVITLEADNDFYSQRDQLRSRGLAVSRTALASLPPFLPSLVDESGQAKVAKTGMGSSAALITSLVGALLGFFDAAQLPTKAGPHDTSTQAGVTLVHNLAQIAHSIAQEKIGSGFDVSAAVYGNQQYNRFRPDEIQPFLADDVETVDPVALAAQLTAPWDNVVRPFCLPEGMHMIMGDVNAGSATVSMVRKVLTWQSHDPVGAAALWADLNAQNMAIPALFEQLHALQAQDSALTNTTKQRSVSELLEELSRMPFHEWTAADAVVGTLLTSLRTTFQGIRALLRNMGELAQVGIEPTDQTALIDATMAVPGVLFAGVPGAGGNDAIFAIVLHVDVLDAVEAFWSTWTATSVSALLVDAAPNGFQGGLLRHNE